MILLEALQADVLAPAPLVIIVRLGAVIGSLLGEIALHQLNDNQSAIEIIRTGKNPTMRHLQRTHRVQVGWIHEQYMSGNFTFAHESGERMPPDIFTKMFADKDKWKMARQLINVILPQELSKVIEEAKAIYEGIQLKPALGASVRASPGGGTSSSALARDSAAGRKPV